MENHIPLKPVGTRSPSVASCIFALAVAAVVLAALAAVALLVVERSEIGAGFGVVPTSSIAAEVVTLVAALPAPSPHAWSSLRGAGR